MLAQWPPLIVHFAALGKDDMVKKKFIFLRGQVVSILLHWSNVTSLKSLCIYFNLYFFTLDDTGTLQKTVGIWWVGCEWLDTKLQKRL